MKWPKRSRSDDANDYERLCDAQSSVRYVLTLYVAGMASRSLRAIANVKNVCEEHLKGRVELKILDIYQHPELAESNQVIAAPTLIKEHPSPARRLIGDLSNREHVLSGLNIVIRPPPKLT